MNAFTHFEMIGNAFLIYILLISTGAHRSFVDTAPSPSTVPAEQVEQKGSPEVVPEIPDVNVRDLEDLKQSIGKTLELMKTQSSIYTNINGHKEAHSNSKSEVKEDGKVLATIGQQIEGHSDNVGKQNGADIVRTELNIPAKGIHKSLVEQLIPNYLQYTANGNRRSKSYETRDNNNNNLEKYSTYSGTHYSPLDMAEYVFWTGDEKGVTLAIEEFLQEGIMSREEAISFLQDIKYNLDYLQNHYTQLGLNASDRLKDNNNGVNSRVNEHESNNNFDLTKLRQQIKKKGQVYNKGLEASVNTINNQRQQELEYNEILERLRVADFLYTEYSLEEVIYQLAKVMFTQSLTRGSTEAQQALQKFTMFLETEANQGHISRALEKKVLDVLIASLSDTLNDHPELAGSTWHVHEGQNIVQQILQLTSQDKANVLMEPNGDGTRNSIDLQNPVDIHLNDKTQVPIGLGKYKTIR